MTAKELNSLLILFLPELKEEYDKCVSWQEGDDTGPHVVFGSVLVPYIVKCANEKNNAQVQKCMQLLEYVLSLNDVYSEEVIAFSVLESLLFSDKLESDIYELLGTETQKLYDEVKEWWSNRK